MIVEFHKLLRCVILVTLKIRVQSEKYSSYISWQTNQSVAKPTNLLENQLYLLHTAPELRTDE
jgi:hypothetical protein